MRQWTEKTVMPQWDLKGMARWCGWFVVLLPLDVDGDLVKNAPNLKVIAQAAVGYDNVKLMN